MFRNLSAHGVIDLIGIKHGIAEFFYVKSKGNSGGLSTEAKILGVKRIIVNGGCEVRVSKNLN